MIKIRSPKFPLSQHAFTKMFESIDGHSIPQDYLFSEDSKTIAAYDSEDKLLGGFCLVSGNLNDGFANLRTVKQARLFFYGKSSLDNLTEITGYFIADKKCGLKLTMRLVLEVLRNPSNSFIYSYAASNKKLESYYKTGNPKRMFSGYIYYPNDYNIENVEILSKWGIIKIFLNRTMKLIKRKLK